MREAKLGNSSSIFVHDKGEFISDFIFDSCSYFEEDSLRYFSEKYRPRVIVDVGANIGNHSKFFIEEFDCKVLAFEPCKRNFNLLKKNASKGCLINAALGDHNSVSELITYDSCLGNNTIKDSWERVPSWGKGINKELVSVLMLDNFHLPYVSMIKIDVEGFELRVLKGATNFLKISYPIIWIELHPDENLLKHNFEYSRNDIISFLGANGYKLAERDRYGNHIFVYAKIGHS